MKLRFLNRERYKKRVIKYASLRGVSATPARSISGSNLGFNLRLCEAMRSNPGFLKKSSNYRVFSLSRPSAEYPGPPRQLIGMSFLAESEGSDTGLSRKKILRGDSEQISRFLDISRRLEIPKMTKSGKESKKFVILESLSPRRELGNPCTIQLSSSGLSFR